MRKLSCANSHTFHSQEIISTGFAAFAMFDRIYCVVGSLLLFRTNPFSNSISSA
jgi:hypothetical protein